MEKRIRLRDDSEVTIRDLTPDDVDASLDFFRALPDEDRLYLRNDVTRREVVERRIHRTDRQTTLRLVAVDDASRIVADGSIESEGFAWKDHVAELRLIVAREHQRKSLGMALARELFLLAVNRRVDELTARVMRPQTAALKVVERLGFREEAILPDYVKDLKGRKHDLILMRCEVQKLLDELESYFAMGDWQRSR